MKKSTSRNDRKVAPKTTLLKKHATNKCVKLIKKISTSEQKLMEKVCIFTSLLPFNTILHLYYEPKITSSFRAAVIT